MNSEVELKPCPFCGGDVRFLPAQNTNAGTDMVACYKCGCRFYTSDLNKWNRRVISEAAKSVFIPLLDSVHGDCYMGQDWEDDKVYDAKVFLKSIGEYPFVIKDDDK